MKVDSVNILRYPLYIDSVNMERIDMERKEYHHKDLKTELLEAGILLLNSEGLEGLSLRKVAAACGVSHTAPYRHFKNKEELLAAMQRYVEQEFADALYAAIDSGGGSPDAMVYFGQAYVRFFEKNPQYYWFFTRQNNIHVSFLSPDGVEGNYLPFTIFKDMASRHLRKWGRPKEMWPSLMASMWAVVHGFAGVAVMPGVQYDGSWSELTAFTLKNMGGHTK